MTPARVQAMVQSLPPGLSELYFHPATSQDETLRRLMPGYQHEAEFDALLRTIVPANVTRTRYSDLPSAAPPGRPGRPAAQPDNRGL
jgi:hypothetical protein